MPRTLYDKLQVILQTCERKPGLTDDDLADEVLKGKPNAFRIVSHAGGRKTITYNRPQTVKESIRLLVDLNLIDSIKQCRLTPEGRKALTKYADTLEQAVINYLDGKHGLPFEKVGAEIMNIKSSQTNNVPTARDIHTALLAGKAFSKPIGVERFVRLLNLLSQCGLLAPHQPKFYWLS